MNRYQALKNQVATRLLKAAFVERHVQEKIAHAYPGTCQIDEIGGSDVFLVGYPKSGNTWMQHLVASLVYGLGGWGVPARLIQELVPDVHYKTYYQRFSDVVCFKSHFLPRPEYRKVIYIVRDGRDVMVSYWHFHKAMTGQELDYDDLVVSSIHNYGTWADHVRTWMDNMYTSDILFIRYEDLLNTAEVEVKKIVDFLSIERTDDEIIKVINKNKFSRLKENEKKLKLMNDVWTSDKPFFRRGVSGSYEEEMPLSALRIFNETYKNELKMFNYI